MTEGALCYLDLKDFAEVIFPPQRIKFRLMEESLAKKLHQNNKIFRGRENESNHYGYWK
jgi:hypothetical protein